MGLRDAEEMLEAAKADVLRLERELAAVTADRDRLALLDLNDPATENDVAAAIVRFHGGDWIPLSKRYPWRRTDHPDGALRDQVAAIFQEHSDSIAGGVWGKPGEWADKVIAVLSPQTVPRDAVVEP